jgi:hypothetical protein
MPLVHIGTLERLARKLAWRVISSLSGAATASLVVRIFGICWHLLLPLFFMNFGKPVNCGPAVLSLDQDST